MSGPFNQWTPGCIAGLIVASFVFEDGAAWGQEPFVRVLLLQSSKVRLRADGDEPLLLKGYGSFERKISALKVRLINGKPQIFIDGRLLGGYESLLKLQSSGELDKFK